MGKKRKLYMIPQNKRITSWTDEDEAEFLKRRAEHFEQQRQDAVLDVLGSVSGSRCRQSGSARVHQGNGGLDKVASQGEVAVG